MSIPAIDIEKLAPEERLQLIEELWDSLRAQPEALRLTSAQQAELDRRLDDFDRGHAEVISWDEAKRHLRG
jgi:putative addiction module component (TIGR02574 family)